MSASEDIARLRPMIACDLDPGECACGAGECKRADAALAALGRLEQQVTPKVETGSSHNFTSGRAADGLGPSPDLASLVASLTAERDDALTTLRRVVANESNHYDRYWTPAPKPLTEEWLVATEAKMREALTDVFCDDAAAVMLELIAEIRHLQSAIRALYGTDVWWLIERGQPEGQAPTMWVTANNYEYAGFEWTEDANKAMRWSLKDGAEEYIAEHFTHPVRGPSARAVEHAWFTR